MPKGRPVQLARPDLRGMPGFRGQRGRKECGANQVLLRYPAQKAIEANKVRQDRPAPKVTEASKVQHHHLRDQLQTCAPSMPRERAFPAKQTNRLCPQFAKGERAVQFWRTALFAATGLTELWAYACASSGVRCAQLTNGSMYAAPVRLTFFP